MPTSNALTRERKRLEQAWATYVHEQGTPNMKEAVTRSWERSSYHVSPLKPNVPVYDPLETEKEWQDSLLYRATQPLLDEIKRTADESNYIVALCDGSGKLLWTHSSRAMLRRAERLNFVPGGVLSEQGAGTNALDLALRDLKPAKVFSAEHYMQAFHDWVCYSAPIRDPDSGLPLGVLDFSSHWRNANTLGLMTATALARYIEARLQGLSAPELSKATLAAAPLKLKFCGDAAVTLDGKPLKLSPRQLEILALLALHPEGLSLNTLHAYLYGDQEVSFSTLKAEVSLLRGFLGGAIGSRPYGLTLRYQADCLEVESSLREGDVQAAARLYTGQFLPFSDAPRLSEWRNYLDNAFKNAVLQSAHPDLLWHYNSVEPDDLEVLLRLGELLPNHDPRLPLVKARVELLQPG